MWNKDDYGSYFQFYCQMSDLFREARPPVSIQSSLIEDFNHFFWEYWRNGNVNVESRGSYWNHVGGVAAILKCWVEEDEEEEEDERKMRGR
jgi:hypothetical protein